MTRVVRLILIDDSNVSCAVFKRMAADLGHDVTASATVAEALQVAAVEPAGAIVVDGRLPGLDLEADVGVLRAAAASKRIFIIAAIDERALLRRATDAGAAGVVVRPFRRSQLCQVLAGDACATTS